MFRAGGLRLEDAQRETKDPPIVDPGYALWTTIAHDEKRDLCITEEGSIGLMTGRQTAAHFEGIYLVDLASNVLRAGSL